MPWEAGGDAFRVVSSATKRNKGAGKGKQDKEAAKEAARKASEAVAQRVKSIVEENACDTDTAVIAGAGVGSAEGKAAALERKLKAAEEAAAAEEKAEKAKQKPLIGAGSNDAASAKAKALAERLAASGQWSTPAPEPSAASDAAPTADMEGTKKGEEPGQVAKEKEEASKQTTTAAESRKNRWAALAQATGEKRAAEEEEAPAPDPSAKRKKRWGRAEAPAETAPAAASGSTPDTETSKTDRQPPKESEPKKSLFIGSWVYGQNATTYKILESFNNPDEFIFEGPSSSGSVTGHLTNIPGFDANWRQASLQTPEGQPVGSIRLQYSKMNDTMVSNFKRNNKPTWGEDVVAHRTKVVAPPPRPAAEEAEGAKDKDTDKGTDKGTEQGTDKDADKRTDKPKGVKVEPIRKNIEPEPAPAKPAPVGKIVEHTTLDKLPVGRLKAIAKYHTVSLAGCAEKSDIVKALLAKGIPNEQTIEKDAPKPDIPAAVIPSPVASPEPQKPKKMKPAQELPLDRRILKTRLFQVLDADRDRFLNSGEMLVMGRVLGFEGSDAEWCEEYARLCKENGCDRARGVSEAQMMKLLDDESPGGLYSTEQDLVHIIDHLEKEAVAQGRTLDYEANSPATTAPADSRASSATTTPSPPPDMVDVPMADGREVLKKKLFMLLDRDGNGLLNSIEMLALGKIIGFEGSDDEWSEEYGRMCSEGGAETDKGISEDLLFKMLDDDSDSGCYLDEDDLTNAIASLQGGA